MNKILPSIFNAARAGASGRTALAIASLTLGCASAQADTTLFEDTFSDGATKDSWVQMNNGATTFGYDGQATIVPAIGNPSSLWHNFSDTVLQQGETLKLSFEVQMSSTTSQTAPIRFGLGYSAAALVDGRNLSIPADGYIGLVPFLGNDNDPSISWMEGPINWGNAQTAGQGSLALDNNDLYTITNSELRTVTFEITRDAGDSLRAVMTVNGESTAILGALANSISDFKFNALGLIAPYNAGETFTYDNVKVEILSGNALEVGHSIPSVDNADIAMLEQNDRLSTGGVDAIWSNQPAQGTTFTTGSDISGYELSAFTMQGNANTDSRLWSMKVRVGRVYADGATITEMVRDFETASTYGQFGDDLSGNNFITYRFSTPVHLEPNTVYVVDMTAGADNGYGFPPYYKVGNPYAGGKASGSGTQNVADSADLNLAYADNNRDRVFHLDLEATVGESGSWTAATNTNWDSSTANWTSTDNLFADGDLVSFGDTGAGTVTLQENVAPGSVSFANTAGNDYTIASAAAETLSAAGGISLTDAGNLTIDSVIVGATSIAHTGTGTLTLNGTNTFTGGVTLADGATLDISGTQSLGDYSQATALTIAAGASLVVGNGDTLNGYGIGSIKLSGAGVGGAGAIDFAAANNYSLFNGQWDLLNDTTVDVAGGRMDYDGPISTTGAADVVLTKNGAGRLMVGWDLSGATNLYEVVVTAGELMFEGAPDNGSTPIRMQSGTTFARFHTGNSTTNGDFVLDGATLTTLGADNLVYTWSGDFAVTAASTFTTQKTTHSLVTTGALSGAGDIALGGSTVRFDGSSTSYSGNVSFSGNSGTLEVNGDYSGATGTIYVASGTTLTGTGTWGGDVVVEVGGTLDDGSLTLVPPADVVIESSGFNGANFEVQLSGLVNGTTYYLMLDDDLSDGAQFTTEADNVTAASDTATLTHVSPPANQAFYQVTD